MSLRKSLFSACLLALAAALPVRLAAATVAADDPGLRYVGRVDFSDPKAPRFNWPGVYVEASFTGNNLGILLAEQSEGYFNYFDASVDGKAPQRLTTSSASLTRFDLKNLGAGPHRLKLLRRSESYFGVNSGKECSIFGGLELEPGAKLLPLPPRRPRRIEIIGDSLSAGFGNESAVRDCSPTAVSPLTNNGLAYGSLVAEAFCAELHCIALSGHGVLHNWGDTVVNSVDPMPVVYERTLHSSPESFYPAKDWQPDAVIILLGANDFSNVNPPSLQAWEAAYSTLIARVRKRYAASNPWIFCLYQAWPEQVGTGVKDVVTRLSGAGKDAKLRAVELGALDGSACAYHPNLAGHRAMAAKVMDALASATGWSAGGCAAATGSQRKTAAR